MSGPVRVDLCQTDDEKSVDSFSAAEEADEESNSLIPKPSGGTELRTARKRAFSEFVFRESPAVPKKKADDGPWLNAVTSDREAAKLRAIALEARRVANKQKKPRRKVVIEEEDDEEDDEESAASSSSEEVQEENVVTIETESSGASSDEEDEVREVLRSCAEYSARIKNAASRCVASEFEIVEALGCDKLKLKPHQIVGVNWLLVLENAGVCGILADEMGLGKTVQTIAYLTVSRKKKKRKHKPDLVVAPASTLDNWAAEIKKFAPGLRALVYRGSMAERGELRSRFYPEDVDMVVTTYAYWERDACGEDRAFFLGIGWDHLILDEGHSLKNPTAKRSVRLRDVGRRSCESRTILSGTPIQNEPLELLALLSFLMPNFKTDQEYDVETLRTILGPFVLRRVKRDVLDSLPPKSEIFVKVELDPSQRTTYDSVIERAATKTNDAIFTDLRKAANHPLLLRRIYKDKDLQRIAKTAHRQGTFGQEATLNMVLAELDKYCDYDLHQLSLDLIGGDGDKKRRSSSTLLLKTLQTDSLFASAKFQKLRDLLPKLKRENHRVLLFSQWTRLLDLLGLLCEHLGLSAKRLDGSTEVNDRQRLVNDFNAGDGDIFLLSTRAGGLGINLVGADTVVVFDSDWNPEIDRQAEDRSHRMGQTKPVTIYRMVALNTVDDDINKVAAAKRSRNNLVMDDEDENDDNGRDAPPAKKKKKNDEDNRSAIADAVHRAIQHYQATHPAGSSTENAATAAPSPPEPIEVEDDDDDDEYDNMDDVIESG